MKRIGITGILLLLFLLGAPLAFSAPGQINWTEDELLFMAAHPVIRLGVDPLFVPFEFISPDGEHEGIAADYLALISDRTGLTFEVRKGLSWPEAYDLAAKRQLDVLPAIGKTEERQQSFLFSDPYYYFKRVIATRDLDTHISNLDDLAGQAVAVQRNSSHHSYLAAFPQINLSLYNSVESALAAVATGTEVAFVGNLATTNYLIRTHGLTNLRFVAFEAEKQQALHLAVRTDWPQLVSILNKAIAAISEKERSAINKKWIDLETHFDYGPLIKKALTAASFFIVILTLSLFWIRRLQKEVRRRQQTQRQLEKANQEADLANTQLLLANQELEKISMVDGLTGISNRRYFDSFLQKLWGINMRERFPIALIMIDIDNFKIYNDTYGHLAGDQCLKNVARLINNTVRRPGDFVARFGGEEFAVLLSNTTEIDAAQLGERIRKNVEKAAFTSGGAKTSVTVSLGVGAMVSSRDMGPTDLINAADGALYAAKAGGRNKVVLASSLNDA